MEKSRESAKFDREYCSIEVKGCRHRDEIAEGRVASAVDFSSIADMPDQGAEGWTVDELQQAGKLLMSMREVMVEAGICSIHDPGVSMNVRRLWQRLVNSRALDTLSCRDLGLLWAFVKLPKATEIQHASAMSHHQGDSSAPRRTRAVGRRNGRYRGRIGRSKPRKSDLLGAGWMN